MYSLDYMAYVLRFLFFLNWLKESWELQSQVAFYPVDIYTYATSASLNTV